MMRAVVCRAVSAEVSVEGRPVGGIERGLLAYIGVERGDGPADADWLADKLLALRLFPDDAGRMNRSLTDVAGGLLLIPNFTLAGRTRKGTRPSFTDAAAPADARRLFERAVERCGNTVHTATGRFGADMRIRADFDGPVTVVVETPR